MFDPSLLTANYIKVQLNWNAYYNRFKELHGQWPVKWKGRLLFPDGWTYSSTDTAGPEWPPPKDPRELIASQLAYWGIRRGTVKHELKYLENLIHGLEELQRQKSAPLQQALTRKDEETGYSVTEYQDVSAKDIQEGRFNWLLQDLIECTKQIVDLKSQLAALVDPEVTQDGISHQTVQ